MTHARRGTADLRNLSCRLAGALAVALATLVGAEASGATFVVNNNADIHDPVPGDGVCGSPGVCTLRAALEEANQTTGAVVQVPAATIVLTLGHLEVKSSMTIVGAGMRATVVGAANASCVFIVGTDPATIMSVSISRMTLRDGDDSTDASAAAGAVTTQRKVSLSLDSCLLIHHRGYHGAISVAPEGAALTMKDCVVTDSEASSTGGAIYVNATSGTTTVTGSTLHGNRAQGGGAICVGGGTVNLVNTTVSSNIAILGGGGGILVVDGALHLYNATVAFNTAESEGLGGGIYGYGGTAVLVGSILAYNEREFGDLIVPDDCAGSLTASSTIIPNVVASHCAVTGSFATSSPLLGPLQDNGGAAPTHALLQASPGIDGVGLEGCKSETGAVLAFDSRGVHRPIGAACDLGAYERSPCGDANGDGVVSAADVFILINSLFAGGPRPPGLANVNQDSVRDVSDVFFLINALFAGGPAPSCPGT